VEYSVNVMPPLPSKLIMPSEPLFDLRKAANLLIILVGTIIAILSWIFTEIGLWEKIVVVAVINVSSG
jgi:hypothetical protein